jgi:hypothetical protein
MKKKCIQCSYVELQMSKSGNRSQKPFLPDFNVLRFKITLSAYGPLGGGGWLRASAEIIEALV